MKYFRFTRWIQTPKRPSEIIAFLALSTTLFLFIHTNELRNRLRLAESVNTVSSWDSSGNQQQQNNFPSKSISIIATKDETAASLNITGKAKKELIFFNRVPKVGSQTFMELLRQLSYANRFTFYRDKIQRVETIRLKPEDEERLAVMVNSYRTPSVYVKHVCFTNFTKYKIAEPIYINIVRDPVERIISWYYYIRAPWYFVERKRAFPDLPLPDSKWLKKDFETCVKNGDKECRYIEGETKEGIGDHRRQTLFFCGHESDCTPFNSEAALSKAKEAVEKYYAVVGVLEEFNMTLTVLQHYIPRFFKGASQIYYGRDISQVNKNMYKPPVSEEVKNIVRKNFTREIEFYEFCKQRLYRQYKALKLN